MKVEMLKLQKRFMKNTYNIKFSDLNENADFKEMFLALEKGFKKFEIDFYLVGAIAKNIWISSIHKVGPSRTTKDFDVAVLIADKKEFNNLKEFLINENNFVGSSENAFALIWNKKYFIDLLPFGEIENEESNVLVDGKGFINMSVPGFYDIYKNELSILNVEDIASFQICSLTDIIILKFFAWNDRPEHREKDITDIGEILYSYFDMNDEFIYENYSFLFDELDDLKQLSAVVIGLEIKKTLLNNLTLLNRLLNIIRDDLENLNNPKLALLLVKEFDTSIDFNNNIFKNIINGLERKLPQ